MIITHDRERLLASIWEFSKRTKYCGVTKLLKLLYFLDFDHFRQTGKTVTGLDYHAWQFGPVSTDLYHELSGMKPDLKKVVKVVDKNGFKHITPIPVNNPYADYLSPRQMGLIDKYIYIFKDAQAADMVESTHLPNHPWDKTITEKGEKEKIDIFLALDGSKESLSEEEAALRVAERNEMMSIFGAA